MNLRFGGISISNSALYAQQMGNEVAYFCDDEVLGWYISPLPCDEGACHQACRLKDKDGNDCIWEGDCVDYDFHVEVEHSNLEPPTPPDDDDDKSGGSENQGSGNQGSGSSNFSGSSNSFSGSGGFSLSSDYNKISATNIVNRFRFTSTTTVFPNLSAQRYAMTLLDLLNNPDHVQQGENGTCGAAVLAKFLLENDPVLFVNMAIGLYKAGQYELAPNLKLYLPESSFYGADEQLFGIGTTSVDALVQGAIINWANKLLTFNPFEGRSDLCSALFPIKIKEFVTILGYDVEIKGNSIVPVSLFPLTFDDIRSYNINYNNSFVIGYVQCGDCGNFDSTITNHYVQIRLVDFDLCKVTYWSWGKEFFSQNSDCSTGICTIFIIKKK